MVKGMSCQMLKTNSDRQMDRLTLIGTSAKLKIQYIYYPQVLSTRLQSSNHEVIYNIKIMHKNWFMQKCIIIQEHF